MKTKILIILTTSLILLGGYNLYAQQARNWELLFEDNFETGEADNWLLETGWTVEQDNGNHVLSGVEHYWVRLGTGKQWTDYSFKTKVKLIKGFAHLNYRVTDQGRYFIGFTDWGLYLS